MSSADDKWEHELEVLNQAFSYARLQGGEARRNVNRLSGKPNSKRESPDIVIEKDDGSVIGLEHFRIDKLVRNDKKVKSAAMEYENRLYKFREGLLPELEKSHLSDEAAGKFGEFVYNGIRLYAHSDPNDLVRSLHARLYGNNGHALKLGAYRDHLINDYPHAPSIEFGYLIEMHADFTGMFFNEKGRVTRLLPGQIPLFEKLFDMLESAARCVDWIVIANYSSIGESIVDAAVIRCKDGLFKKSCERQGFRRTFILDPGIASSLVDKGNHYTPEFERMGEEISYKIERAFRIPNSDQYFKCAKRLAAKAIACDFQKVPFLASTGVQTIYSLVRDRFPRYSVGKIKKSNTERALAHISDTELDARLDDFERKWFAEGYDKFSVTPNEMEQSLSPN